MAALTPLSPWPTSPAALANAVARLSRRRPRARGRTRRGARVCRIGIDRKLCTRGTAATPGYRGRTRRRLAARATCSVPEVGEHRRCLVFLRAEPDRCSPALRGEEPPLPVQSKARWGRQVNLFASRYPPHRNPATTWTGDAQLLRRGRRGRDHAIDSAGDGSAGGSRRRELGRWRPA